MSSGCLGSDAPERLLIPEKQVVGIGHKGFRPRRVASFFLNIQAPAQISSLQFPFSPSQGSFSLSPCLPHLLSLGMGLTASSCPHP